EGSRLIQSISRGSNTNTNTNTNTNKMNCPAACCGASVSIDRYKNVSKIVTPECFYRGSSSNFACGEPVEPPLKACGNDAL
ncbi:MAG TPA: hypothetical protein VGK77_12050, partial [Candidatus Binatia bacterium]